MIRKDGHEIFISIHRVIRILSVIVPLTLLVVFFVRFFRLPEEIGVHFDGKGQFDLIDKKIYGLYAWLIILITQGITVLCERMLPKVRSGLHLGEKAERIFRDLTLLWMDVISAGITAFFCTFGACVTWQKPYPVSIGVYFLVPWTFLLLLYPVGTIIAKIVCKIIKWSKRNA